MGGVVRRHGMWLASGRLVRGRSWVLGAGRRPPRSDRGQAGRQAGSSLTSSVRPIQQYPASGPSRHAAAANEIDRSMIDLLDQNIEGATAAKQEQAAEFMRKVKQAALRYLV